MLTGTRVRSDGCAAVRAVLDEPLRATAPERAASWLLVEHPGPWPSADLPGDLPAEAREVLEAVVDLDIRPQLVRRVAQRRRPTSEVVLASCRAGRRWTERRSLTDLRALADLDLPALADGSPPGFGDRTDEPLVLVCTHGRRDVCCARLGRPLAVQLDAVLPGRVWETTHVGGDRFAPNVVALPDGSYHGGLRAADVPALAAAVTAHAVLLPRLRGRAGIPAAAQAAEQFLREHLGATLLDDVVAGTTAPLPHGATRVELQAGTGCWAVDVHVVAGAGERLTSCAAGGTVGVPSAYELLDLRRLP